MTHVIAALQTSPRATMAAALGETLELAEEAVRGGATFIGTPEYCGGLVSQGPELIPPHAPEEAHEYLAGVKTFAAENSVWFMVGSVAITGPAGRIFNRGFVIDDKGAVRSRYNKIHMFDIQLSEKEVYRESARVEAGDQAVVMDTPLGRMGHTICYDLRFPHLYRDLGSTCGIHQENWRGALACAEPGARD